MKYQGLLTFVPVADPGLPEPYATGTAEEKQAYEASAEGKAQYWENFQKLNNHERIAGGNKAAENAVKQYNTQLKAVIDNPHDPRVGPKPDLNALNLEQYYPPANNAALIYQADGNKPGSFVPNPNAPKIETPVWSLPVGTVLYTV